MQNKGKWAIAVGIIAILLLGVRMVMFSGVSDHELIRQTIDEALAAGRDGRPGGVLEQLSQTFQFNDEAAWDKRQLAQVIRTSRPEITLYNREPVIRDDTATVVTRARVRGQALGMPINFDIPSVTIQLRRGTQMRYWIVPMKKWRIVSISAPGFSGAEFLPQ